MDGWFKDENLIVIFSLENKGLSQYPEIANIENDGSIWSVSCLSPDI
jgi:uncharacterized protein YdhG (YjbR/CyaY superfamily)